MLILRSVKEVLNIFNMFRTQFSIRIGKFNKIHILIVSKNNPGDELTKSFCIQQYTSAIFTFWYWNEVLFKQKGRNLVKLNFLAFVPRTSGLCSYILLSLLFLCHKTTQHTQRHCYEFIKLLKSNTQHSWLNNEKENKDTWNYNETIISVKKDPLT